MNNKFIGIILIIIALVLSGLLFYINIKINDAYEAQINFYNISGDYCPSDPAICPHSQEAKANTIISIGYFILLLVLLLGIFIIFFDFKKTKEEIIINKERKRDDNFKILMSALNEDEKKVMEAVKGQDGITQSTLRIRTDLSKTKLSFVLKDLEKKDLIKKVEKGKTNQIFLKKKI